jgi:hypothetical protein
MNDADLARALHALDPAASVSDDRTERQVADDLRDITTAAERRTSRRWPWIAAPSVAAAAAIIALVAGFWTPLTPQAS